MQGQTQEISKQVEKAIVEITIAKDKGASYGELAIAITKASLNYNLTEEYLRQIGGWKLNTIDVLVDLYYEADACVFTDEANRLKSQFKSLYSELNKDDKRQVDELTKDKD